MTNHQRRFVVPSPAPAAKPGAVVPPALAPAPNACCSPAVMLAQIYAMAYQQARQALQRRQWDELLERLFNSPS